MPSANPPAAVQHDSGCTAAFVPLALPASPVSTDIRIELQHAGTVVNVSWPASAAAEWYARPFCLRSGRSRVASRLPCADARPHQAGGVRHATGTSALPACIGNAPRSMSGS